MRTSWPGWGGVGWRSRRSDVTTQTRGLMGVRSSAPSLERLQRAAGGHGPTVQGGVREWVGGRVAHAHGRSRPRVWAGRVRDWVRDWVERSDGVERACREPGLAVISTLPSSLVVSLPP